MANAAESARRLIHADLRGILEEAAALDYRSQSLAITNAAVPFYGVEERP
jgi:hypothetical protein